MPADSNAAQQRQQQPQVSPTFALEADPALAMLQAPYAPYIAPMGGNPPSQGPLSMQPMPTAHPGYNAPGPFRPPTGCQFSSIHVSPVTMANREGYSPCTGYLQRSSQTCQTDPPLPNSNMIVDRRPEGRSALNLTREVAQFPSSRDNLRWEPATNMDPERRIGETWLPTDHRQDRATRFGHNNERRYRRSRSPPPRDREYSRLPARYPSLAGHDNRHDHFDNRQSSHRPWSSVGSHLSSPSSRCSPSQFPSSMPTTSETASSRQPSTFPPSSVASPANQDSTPVAGPSPAVHGPEIAFDSADEWDDDEFDEITAYDAKKGKDRAFNARNRAANRRIRQAMQAKYAPRRSNLAHPAPQWQPTRVPALPPNPALDPPQVSGAEREAHMDVWPQPTNVDLADQWSDYVPLNNVQCADLLRSARAYDSGAAQRVRDLIHQYDENHELSALGYLNKLKQVWSDPHRDRDLRGPRRRRSGRQ